MQPIAIVLNGSSSSGKTSIARAMQEIWPAPLIHASLDSFTDVFRWTAIQDEPLRRKCHQFGIGSFHDYLSRTASSPFSIVVDHVLELPAWHEDTCKALEARPTWFVAVRCPVEILETREKTRGNRRGGLARSQFELVHKGKIYDLEVDTVNHSSEECADLILKEATEKWGVSKGAGLSRKEGT